MVTVIPALGEGGRKNILHYIGSSRATRVPVSKTKQKPGVVVAKAFNPSVWEAEASRSSCVQGQSGLHTKLQDSQTTQRDPVSKSNKQANNPEMKQF